MQRRAPLILLILFWCGALHDLFAAESQPRWEYSAPNESTVYDARTGFASGTNITIKYSGTTLYADTAQVNQTSGVAVAEGHVLLQREGDIWEGDSLQYNFKTKEM